MDSAVARKRVDVNSSFFLDFVLVWAYRASQQPLRSPARVPMASDGIHGTSGTRLTHIFRHGQRWYTHSYKNQIYDPIFAFSAQ